MAPKPVVTYDEKLNHVKVVAQRDADARKFAEESGHFRTGAGARESAVRVFRGMAVEHSSEYGSILTMLALQDTPSDHLNGVSNRWAQHIQDVFVNSYLAGEPKPALPN